MQGLFQLNVDEWIAAILIGVFSTAIPWAIWSSSLKHLDVHVAASFNLLIPPFAALYAFLFLQQEITLWMIAGMLLVSVGIYVVQWEEKKLPTLHQ
jgi:drug/metabolite transporter (DMT)-like permease